MTTITLTLSAQNKYSIHKLTLTPSVAVNPPAIQYFHGMGYSGYYAASDYRFIQMKDWVIQMLSSKDYPNSPICSIKRAITIANKLLPILLKRVKNKDITTSTKIKI